MHHVGLTVLTGRRECRLSDWERPQEWDGDRVTDRQLAYCYMCCRHGCGRTRRAEQHGTDNTGRSGCSEEETVQVGVRRWWYYVRAARSSLHILPCNTTVVRNIFFLYTLRYVEYDLSTFWYRELRVYCAVRSPWPCCAADCYMEICPVECWSIAMCTTRQKNGAINTPWSLRMIIGWQSSQ